MEKARNQIRIVLLYTKLHQEEQAEWWPQLRS